MPDNTLVTTSVIEPAPSLPRPRLDRDGVQVCEVEARRLGRSEYGAVEGFGEGEQEVGFDGRAALGAAGAAVAVDDGADVFEGDVICGACERLAVDDGRIGLGRRGRVCEYCGAILSAEVAGPRCYTSVIEPWMGAGVDETRAGGG